jgi:deazaflavin-dependent oxidoreductase (nitroreductase family)
VHVTARDALLENARAAVCHLQTIGRTSGQPRTIEIWFATDGERIYLLAGGRERAHWVRNLQREPRVLVRLGGRTLAGVARVVADPERDALARRLLAAKYQGWTEGAPLSSWASASLPVEIEIEPDA